MPIYAFICRDGGDKTELRRRHLRAHLTYVETIANHVAVGGPCPPLAAGDSRQFEGSLVLYDAPTEAAARALFENDPYYKNGIWDSCDVMAMTPVVGNYIGGQTWDLTGDQIKFTQPYKKSTSPQS